MAGMPFTIALQVSLRKCCPGAPLQIATAGVCCSSCSRAERFGAVCADFCWVLYAERDSASQSSDATHGQMRGLLSPSDFVATFRSLLALQ